MPPRVALHGLHHQRAGRSPGPHRSENAFLLGYRVRGLAGQRDASGGGSSALSHRRVVVPGGWAAASLASDHMVRRPDSTCWDARRSSLASTGWSSPGKSRASTTGRCRPRLRRGSLAGFSRSDRRQCRRSRARFPTARWRRSRRPTVAGRFWLHRVHRHHSRDQLIEVAPAHRGASLDHEPKDNAGDHPSEAHETRHRHH